MSLLAVAALSVVGCQEEERDLGLPEVKVDQTTLSFGAGIGSGKVKVSATRDWKVVSTVDWIEATPKNGVGYEDGDVTISVLENEGYDRTGAVRIDIGYDYKTILVNQSGPLGPKTEGSGTLEDPYTPAGATSFTSALASDQEGGPIYIKGIISSINTTFEASGNYGNAIFNISEDGTTNGAQFYIYQTYYLGNKPWKASLGPDVKVGDEVIIYGKVVNYHGNTPETVGKGGSYIYSLNGETAGGGGDDQSEPKGTGTLEDPYNPAGAAQAVKDLAWTSASDYEKIGPAYVKGKISKIANKGTYTEGGTYGNASFYITEDGESGTEFYAFRILYLGNKKYESGQTDIKVGDEVVIYGELMNYQGNTPETVAGNAYLYSLNGQGGGDTPTPQPGGDITVATVAQIKDAPVDNEKLYQLTATIKTIKNATYGNLVVSDDTGDLDIQGLIKGTAVGANDKSFADLGLAVGDKITIVGVRQEFNGTPQLGSNNLACYFVSKGEGGDTPTPGGNGSGTLSDPYTPAGAIDAVKDLTWTSNTDYESTEEVYVKGKISRIASGGTYTEGGTYGNASFYISADGTENDEFYAFRILYLGNKKFEAGQTDIKVGDEVIIYGKLMNYRGNTPETVANAAYLYSLNGDTGDGGGDTPTPQPGDITVATVAQIKDAPVDNEKLYQLTATIKTIKNATYGNLVVSDDTGDLDIQGLIKGTAVGANDKSFADLGLAVGDKITIVGVRQEFNGTPQLGSNNLACYFVSKGEGGDTPTPGGNGSGTLSDPYTPAGAIDAVKDLTWTSNTDYESTEEVYVKGKISRIASGGTYTEGGTYGNASFYISADGTENDEFYAFRILYLGNKKFEAGQTDIKVGDEVIIYGKLMNYRGNTPETVANAAYLYSLNGDTGEGGGDTPTPQPGGTVSFDTNSSAQTWAAETDPTYGVGFSSTTESIKIGYYKHTGTTNLVAPNAEHVRIYKNSVIVFTAPEGKKFKSIKMVAPTASNCFNLTGLEGGSDCKADTATLTMTWSGSASKVVLHAVNGQVRCKSVSIEFE